MYNIINKLSLFVNTDRGIYGYNNKKAEDTPTPMPIHGKAEIDNTKPLSEFGKTAFEGSKDRKILVR